MNLNRQQRRRMGRGFAELSAVANGRWSRTLVEVPFEQWPENVAKAAVADRPVRIWRNQLFLAMEFADKGHQRLTVHRTVLDIGGLNWLDGISWEELMALKDQAGFSDRWAVEVYPPRSEVVNVANMRHLWLLPEPPPYGWRGKSPAGSGVAP